MQVVGKSKDRPGTGDAQSGAWVQNDRRNAFSTQANAVPAALANNIEQLVERQKQERGRRTLHMRMADAVTGFAGSMGFVWIHVLWFGAWIALNTGLFSGFGDFDPFPFGLLTMVVSLEAIFLSTFVLISQNRMQASADRRAELDLHVNLLAESEATTILKKLARIEARLGIPVDTGELRVVEELTQETNPVDIVDELERRVEEAAECDDTGQKTGESGAKKERIA